MNFTPVPFALLTFGKIGPTCKIGNILMLHICKMKNRNSCLDSNNTVWIHLFDRNLMDNKKSALRLYIDIWVPRSDFQPSTLCISHKSFETKL